MSLISTEALSPEGELSQMELLERFRAIEELHAPVEAPYYRTAINLDRPLDCAGCGPGHRWPCPTMAILTGSES